MSDVPLIYPPKRTEDTVIKTSKKKKEGLWKPSIIWTVAIIIIVIAIIIGIILMATHHPQTFEQTVDEDVVNLEPLVDAQNDLCCVEIAQVNPTDNYLQDLTLNYIISKQPIKCDNVCAGLTGQQLTDCNTLCKDPNTGDPKPVAHKGITVYYTYTPGSTSTNCQSFQPC